MEFKRDIGGRDLGNLGFPIGNYMPAKLGVPDKRVSIYFRASKYKPYQKRKGRKQPRVKSQPLDKNILALINLQKSGQATISEIVGGNYNAINSQIMALNQNQQQQQEQMREQQRELLNQIDALNRQAIENNQKISDISPELAEQRNALTQQRADIFQSNQQLKNQIDERIQDLMDVQSSNLASFRTERELIMQEQERSVNDIKQEMRRLMNENKEFQENLKRQTDERMKEEIDKNISVNVNLLDGLNKNIQELQRGTDLKLATLKLNQDIKAEESNDAIQKMIQQQKAGERAATSQFEQVNMGLRDIDRKIQDINPQLSRTIEDTRAQINDKLQQLDILGDMQKKSDELQQKNINKIRSDVQIVNEQIKIRNEELMNQMMRTNQRFKEELDLLKKGVKEPTEEIQVLKQQIPQILEEVKKPTKQSKVLEQLKTIDANLEELEKRLAKAKTKKSISNIQKIIDEQVGKRKKLVETGEPMFVKAFTKTKQQPVVESAPMVELTERAEREREREREMMAGP